MSSTYSPVPFEIVPATPQGATPGTAPAGNTGDPGGGRGVALLEQLIAEEGAPTDDALADLPMEGQEQAPQGDGTAAQAGPDGQTQPGQPPATPPPTPASLLRMSEPPEDWAPDENIRAALARLNKEQARTFRGAFFRDKQFQEAGLTPGDARFLKDAGFSVSRARETLERFPTAESEQDTIERAESQAAFEQDFFGEDPNKLLTGLWDFATSRQNPQAFRNLVNAAADLRPKLDPAGAQAQEQADYVRHLRFHFDAVRENAKRSGNEALLAAAEMLFIDAGLDQPEQPRLADPALEQERSRLEMEKRKLENQKAAIENQARERFTGAVVTQARQAFRGEVAKMLDDLAPTALNKVARERIVEATFRAVEESLTANPTTRREVERVLAYGPRNREHAVRAYNLILSRARPLLATKLDDALRAKMEELAPAIPQAPSQPARSGAPAARPPAAAGQRPSPSPAPARPNPSAPKSYPAGWKGTLQMIEDVTAARPGGRG